MAPSRLRATRTASTRLTVDPYSYTALSWYQSRTYFSLDTYEYGMVNGFRHHQALTKQDIISKLSNSTCNFCESGTLHPQTDGNYDLLLCDECDTPTVRFWAVD